MRTLIDFADAAIFAIPVVDERTGSDGLREGMLIEGPQGWGEFSPSPYCSDPEAMRWLTAAIEVGTVGWPDPVRGRVPVSVPVPAVHPAVAHQLVADSGCQTADVAVAESGSSLADDVARLEAVRAAIGSTGKIRCDAQGRWDVDTAVSAIALFDKAVGGLEFVEQPCGSVAELASVRLKVNVRIAADESIRNAAEPLHTTLHSLKDAVDLIVLKCGPLGGVRRALRVAEVCGIASVVSSTVDTTIGLSAGLALAGALPDLPFACGLGTRSLLSADVVAGPRSLVPVDGYLPVAPMPPTPDPDLIATYRMVDPERIGWWRARLRTLTHPDPTSLRAP